MDGANARGIHAQWAVNGGYWDDDVYKWWFRLFVATQERAMHPLTDGFFLRELADELFTYS
jgi:hypothetical protein